MPLLVGGAHDDVALTVTVADADFVVSPTLVAVTVCDPAAEGAV